MMPIDVFFFGSEIEFNASIGRRTRLASVHLLCSSLMSEFNLILCNTVGVSVYYLSVFMMNILGDPSQDFCQNVSQDVSQDVWQTSTAHQSIKVYEFDDYFFASTTEVIGKTTFELEDELEENCMTVHVRTSSGKTISIECDKKQKAATLSEKVERKTSIPRGMTYLVHQGKVLNNNRSKQHRNRSYD